MKTKISLLVLLACARLAYAQSASNAGNPVAIRFDGIYECKEWRFINDNIDNPEPAYYRFYPDGSMLFCRYADQNSVKNDSLVDPQEIFHAVLSQAILDKIREKMEDDPANVYRVYGKFRITAYKYQKITGGICFDILSEKPNCLGKPNMKIVSDVLIKTDNGNPADDRLFKFIRGK